LDATPLTSGWFGDEELREGGQDSFVFHLKARRQVSAPETTHGTREFVRVSLVCEQVNILGRAIPHPVGGNGVPAGEDEPELRDLCQADLG